MTRSSVSFSTRRGNWNNRHTFPDMVYVDANSAIDILLQRTYGETTKDYIVELVKRNGMITWSQHTIDEIIQVIHTDEYLKLAKSKKVVNPRDWKNVENTATDQESSNLAQTVVSKVEIFTSYLEQFGDKTEVDEDELNKLTMQIYSSFGGNQQDSKHLAIAGLTGTNNILTQDSGFLRYPHVNVYGASKVIVQTAKPNQTTADYLDLSEVLFPSPLQDENKDIV